MEDGYPIVTGEYSCQHWAAVVEVLLRCVNAGAVNMQIFANSHKLHLKIVSAIVFHAELRALMR